MTPVVAKITTPQIAVDLDKLAYAVSVAETSGCTTGTAITHNNCHGIMTWEDGVRRPKHFSSTSESFAAFKDLWTRKYGGFPTYAQADKYTGGHDTKTWLENVTNAYYK